MRNLLISLLLLLAPALPSQAGAPQAEQVFLSGFEDIEACETFDASGDTIIVPVINITGDFTLNGQQFPDSEYDDAVFSLRDLSTGNVFELGNSHDLSYSANVVPGRYDVIYSVETSGDYVPRNVGAVLMANISLYQSGTLDIDVTAYTLSGNLLHNGVAFPDSEYDDGIVYLSGPVTGVAELAETTLQSFAGVVVIPGEHEIRYQAETPDTAPWNQWGMVGFLNVTGNAGGLHINIQSVELSGEFSHNGSPMPDNQYDDGNFYLETPSGDRVFLNNSKSGGYQKRVITGLYDTYWELETLGGTVPFNERARIGSSFNISGGNLDIDIASVLVTGSFSLNGGPFPATDEDVGRLILRDTAAGADNELALTKVGGYSRRVILGTYDIVYQHLQGDLVPKNQDAVLGEVAVKSAGTIDINVAAGYFAAPVNHNGVLFPASPLQMGNILLRNPASEDYLVLGKTSLQNLSAKVIPGTYDVYYSHLNGDQVPQNSMARI